MFKTFIGTVVSGVLCATASNAEAPNVVVDLPSVHSLVSIVMDGVGTPDLIIPTTASPHDFALRPSQADDLQNADIVFWVGEDLTPWLSDPIETLAKNAKSVELLEHPKTFVLEIEEGEEEEHDQHDDEEKHDDHGHHDHGDHDPHVWLDPENAIVWLDIIAEQLGALDADHKDAYQKNAEAAKVELEKLVVETADVLSGAKGSKFIVAHDAYAYFAHRFGLEIIGAITETDDQAPSAGRVAKIAELVKSQDAACVFKKTTVKDGLVAAVVGKTDVKSSVLDPMGAGIEVGPAYYNEFITGLATSVKECVS